MWAEIATALANLPVAVAAKVGQTANALLSNVFGIPVWLLALLGAGVGLVAYRVVKR
jgi:DMSO reductase anchor subunit